MEKKIKFNKKEKSATLTLTLKTDVGLSSTEKVRISLEQYTKIVKILNPPTVK